MSRKTSYLLSINKRIVQREIFSRLEKKKLNKVIGLGGPDLTNYLLLLNKYNVKHAEIYEYDISNLTLQLNTYKPIIDNQVLYGDVLYATPDKSDTFYDLDFCCSIINARNHIKKFKNNVCYTLSIRPVGLEKTIKEFSKLIDGTRKPTLTLIKQEKEYKSYSLKTDSKKYLCYIYRDSVPMLTISSI